MVEKLHTVFVKNCILMLQYYFYYSLPLYYCAIFTSLDATTRVSNILDPDQARHFVGPDLGPKCLQRLSTDDKSSLVGKELDTEHLVILLSSLTHG